MAATPMAETMSPQRLKVMERAKDPRVAFLSLAHLIDEAALARAFHRIRKGAAVGVDGITKEQYERELESNLRDLHRRLKAMEWRHQPIRRVHIPKENGKSRPIGISSIEDKIVQGALCELLELIYEPLFRECSYGFRRGRSAHDALPPSMGCCTEEKGTGSWSWTSSRTSTASIARCSRRCSGRGSSMGRC